MSRRSLRVATAQFQHRAGDKTHNIGKVETLARQARESGAKLVLMPEMCISGYWHVPKLDRTGLAALAEPEDGPSLRAIAALARSLDIAIGAGWLEADDNGLFYNAYRLFLPDGSAHTHRKLHAFEHPLIHSGDRYTVFDTPWGVRMAILICWDNNLIENPRACALMGTEVLLAPHQTGGTSSRSPHGMKPIPPEFWLARSDDPERLRQAFAGPDGRGWLLRWLPSRAHDNSMFVVFSNGIGLDQDEVRTGNAMVLDPYGRIVAESLAIEEDIVIAELDLDLVAPSSGRRWMTGRRPELYGILAQRIGNERSARATRFDLVSD